MPTSPNKVTDIPQTSSNSIQKSPCKDLLEKIFKANLFSSLSTSNLPQANKSNIPNQSEETPNPSELDLNQFKLGDIGSASDSFFTKLAEHKHKQAEKPAANSTCANCKFPECKCKFLVNNVSKSQEYVNSHIENPVAYERHKSKENVNRDLSQLLSEIKNSNLSVMKTLAAHKKSADMQISPDKMASVGKSGHQITRPRVNVINT